jgi:hypothetical protein
MNIPRTLALLIGAVAGLNGQQACVPTVTQNKDINDVGCPASISSPGPFPLTKNAIWDISFPDAFFTDGALTAAGQCAEVSGCGLAAFVLTWLNGPTQCWPIVYSPNVYDGYIQMFAQPEQEHSDCARPATRLQPLQRGYHSMQLRLRL